MERRTNRIHAGLRVLWLTSCVSATALAQDIDTSVFPQNRKPFTFLDQIEDPKERVSFLTVYTERRPDRKRQLAEQFLTRYPSSWLLAPVYEAASKSAIELKDYRAALDYGRRSLRFLPENPFLLVPLANVQIEQNLLTVASQSATDALDYLERCGRPAAISEKEWPALASGLRSSALYALGRSAVMQALSGSGVAKRSLLAQAVSNLSRARELNSGDMEAAYLLGVAHLLLGNITQAWHQFSAVSHVQGPLQAKAVEQLRTLPVPPAEQPEPPQSAAVIGPGERYSGSSACRECHVREYSAWSATGMAKMFRPYEAGNIIGDFSDRKPVANESGQQVRAWIAGKRHFLGIGRAMAWERYPVDFTIGSKWQQAYATMLPNGRIQVFPLQYNRRAGAWVNYWKLIDAPKSERADVLRFHQMSEAANYQFNCAPCHTSQLHGKAASRAPENLRFREPGINCEMCHGPSARHVDAMSAGKPYPKGALEPPVAFSRLDNRAYVAICAQCHMQSAMREPGPSGEWNYLDTSGLQTGARFFQQLRNRPLLEFSRKAFYKDGRLRETTFIVEAFVRSACFRRGGATCGHCHDPHPPDAASNPVSLKYRANPDQMCLQCHTKYAGRPQLHTRHAPGSEASQCVGCHMPRTMNSLLFPARTHQIDDIPDADMTLRFGQQESPNTCLICHVSKDARWAGERLHTWRQHGA